MKRKHPIQRTYIDEHGTLRFQENKIIQLLMEHVRYNGFDLNKLYIRHHATDPEDYEQLMMLIGYSISGFEELCSTFAGETKPCKYSTAAQARRQIPRNSPREQGGG